MRPMRPNPAASAWNVRNVRKGKGRHWTEAINRFDEFEQFDQFAGTSGDMERTVTCTEAIHSSGKVSEWQTAVSLLMCLQRKDLADLLCYNSTIGACQKSLQWSAGLRLLSWMAAKLVPDIISFNSFISGCHGRWFVALDFLNGLLKKQRHQSDKLVPNVVTYSSAINACEKDSWFVTLSILDMMRKMMILPNAVSYTSAISACAQEGWWDIAVCLLTSMVAFQVDRNIISYNTAISACGTVGNWSLALVLLSEMEGDILLPDVISYNAAISACAGSWFVAVQHLSGMRSHRIVSDSISYHSLLDVCRGRDADDSFNESWLVASQALQEMRRWKQQQDSITYAIGSLSICAERCGGWAIAWSMLSNMRNATVEFSSMNLSSVLSSRERCGWPTAVAMLKSSQVDTVVCNGILSVLAHADQWLVSLVLLDDMLSSRKNRNVITSISVTAACKTSTWLMAQGALSQISSLQVEGNVVSCSSQISMCERCNEWENALELLRIMSQNGTLLNLIAGNSLLGTLRAQEWTLVWSLFGALGSRSLLPDEISYNGVISACESSVCRVASNVVGKTKRSLLQSVE